jgi:hypothetical protein
MTKLYKLVCQVLVVTLAVFPFNPIHSAMVGTEQLIAQGQFERDKLRQFVDREDVAAQLRSLGVDPAAAKERINALTDDEVQSIAGQLDNLPAGGLVEILLILVIVWLIYLLYVKK